MASRRTIEHRLKIRESCNSCSSQKIRCGKQRPSCARCIAKGLNCSYSYSQRTGRRASSTYTSTSVPTNPPPLTPKVGSETFVGVRSGSRTGDQVFSTPPPTSMPPLMERDCGSLSLDTSSNMFRDTDIFSDINNLIPMDFLWSPLTDPTNGNIAESTTSTNATSNTSNSQTHDLALYSSYPPSNEWQRLQSSGTDFSSDPNPTPVQEPIPRQPAAAQAFHGSQDCMALALQVIFDLHVSREVCAVATSDPMTSMQSTGKADDRDVDSVLFLNRDAIKSINKILDCSCSSDPSVSLACYLATAKVVAWYGAAIGVTDSSNDGLGEEAQSMLNRIVSRPIFMGRYCLDAEAQRSVRAKIVLTELREHIQPLLSRLPKHHISSYGRQDHPLSISSSSAGPGKDGDGYPCALRNQLRRIIREANNINKSA